MIKESIQQQEAIIVNVYTPNARALGHIKHLLTDQKGDMDLNTKMMGDFNTPLSSKDRSVKQ